MVPHVLRVIIADQELEVWRSDQLINSYPVSTSMFGTGSEEGSLRTPLGTFEISEKHGDGRPLNTIFKGRKPVGHWTDELCPEEDDLILGRILRLSGLEPDNANTFERFIYIHGTNHENTIGTATSHGCIRMRMEDIASLYEIVPTGTRVYISPTRPSSGTLGSKSAPD
ncbi:MAG: L,D-transpeptidase [Roseibacillus sp.]|nr:L,D-transpeptidase [Roseibacillus sp.]